MTRNEWTGKKGNVKGMQEVPGKALPCPSFSCPSLWMDLDASTLRFNFTETKKENEGERKRSIERLWVEKCPAGRGGAFNTISCHLHLENVRTGRSKGVLSLGSLRCRLLSELPIHGSHWRNDFPSRHCSHFVSFHWSPLLRRCSSSTRLRGDDQW